jgi:hypothetical protein
MPLQPASQFFCGLSKPPFFHHSPRDYIRNFKPLLELKEERRKSLDDSPWLPNFPDRRAAPHLIFVWITEEARNPRWVSPISSRARARFTFPTVVG